MSSCEKIKYEYLKKIRDINKVTPGIWIIAGRVFQNIKYTLVLNNTFIISVYELNENKLIAVYKVLKELNKTKGIIKVINKKEFLIVKFENLEILKVMLNYNLWKLIDVKEVIEYHFSESLVKLKEDRISFYLDNKKYNVSIYSENCLKLENEENKKYLVLTYSYKFYELEEVILDNLKKLKSN